MRKEKIPRQPKVIDNFIVTLNSMGYMLAKPEKYIQSFIDFSAQTLGPVLDIGAAYGIATIPALKKGAYVIANDMDERHLNILKEKVPPTLQKQLEINVGKMPFDLDFPAGYFSAILASRVLNFIDPHLLSYSFSLIYKWLKPGGKFFYLGGTPYMGTYRRFLHIYEKNKREGSEWPGFIDNIPDYVPEQRTPHLPQFINLIDTETLESLMRNAHFNILEMAYVPAEDKHPEDMKLDGREHLGAIAIKE
ncbi:MAG: class I SAM-dependent methyltransferase [Alphaproteobacteria bacterium]|nr:class I SAM-dependent methyltransferase [Alphaproteobacteria bacterium]